MQQQQDINGIPILLVSLEDLKNRPCMAIARKHHDPKAALRGKGSTTMKHGFPKIAAGGGAARRVNGVCDAEDAALVNAVVKASSADLAR